MSRKPKPDKVQKTSPDLIREHTKLLKALFPECMAEDRVDFEKLKATLGDEVDSGPERYSFTWAGKRDAVRILQTPTPATLIPDTEESVDFSKSKNIFIEGDNLEVLKLLYRAYFGRVKMIYIDPPYNTGNDFIYPDNFTDPLDTYLKITGQKDSEGNHITSNTETNGRYHSAWLTMMYPRLFLARQMLCDNGMMFISIDDHEVYDLRLLMNEIFGEENFICTLIWKRRQNVDSRAKTGVSVDHEYLIVYRRNNGSRLRGQEKDWSKYSNPDDDPRGPWLSGDLTGLATKEQRPNLHYDLVNPNTGDTYPCPDNGWRYGKVTMSRLIEDNRIIWPPSITGRPRVRRYQNELTEEFTGLSSILNTVYNTQGTREVKELFDGKEVMDFPKPADYIKLLIQQGMSCEGEDVVLDFFAGSATTAHAALALNREDHGNRRYIMVQLPEPTGRDDFKTISDIGKERIRRVIRKLKSEKQGKLDLKERKEPEDLGFRVFKLAPSNYKHWTGVEAHDAEALEKQMEAFADPLIDKWKAENVIWEVTIKEGFSLTSQIEKVAGFKDNAVWKVSDPEREQHFRICLDDKIKQETVKRLSLKKDELFVCRDVALDDTLAANMALQCRLKTI